MKVTLKLFATLGRFAGEQLPGLPAQRELHDGATLQDLIRQIQIPEDEVKVCFVNGLIRETDFALTDGDEVGIFPPIGGG